jgi:hypothetical protein
VLGCSEVSPNVATRAIASYRSMLRDIPVLAVAPGDEPVESRVWRGFFRLNISVSARFVWRCPSGSTVAPFPHPAHRTGHAICRIPLSDKTSRFRPRHVASERGQAYEPEVPVKVREWIGRAFASPGHSGAHQIHRAQGPWPIRPYRSITNSKNQTSNQEGPRKRPRRKEAGEEGKGSA